MRVLLVLLPPCSFCRALSASSATAESKNEPLSIELYNNSLADFTTAIHYHSNNHDTHKRRGQVYAALGGEKNNKLAIQGELDDASTCLLFVGSTDQHCNERTNQTCPLFLFALFFSSHTTLPLTTTDPPQPKICPMPLD